MKYKLVGIVADGEALSLDGLNPWAFEWIKEAEPAIIVDHPSYPSQKHQMDIYTIKDGKKTVKFAAGEFSNCLWGFYV